MKIFVLFVGLFIVLPVVGLMISAFTYPLHTAQNMVSTAHDAQDKIINADNAIYNYEWFKQKYADIDVSKKQLVVARRAVASYSEVAGNRSGWTFEDKNEYARLNSISLGIETLIEKQIGDYNARTNMATRSIFEDHVLPSYIDALTFIKK